MNSSSEPGADSAYLRPKSDEVATHELVIKRSRFICLISRITDEGSARAFIDGVRRDYPDARHHCSAYIHHVPQASCVERSSDDGEPSGTAGRPMLEQLKGSGMQDIAAVVVRYFGGVKLGAGGLVHAYSEAVGETLTQVTRVKRTRRELFTLDIPHDSAGRYEAELRARGVDVIDLEYSDVVRLTLSTSNGGAEELSSVIAATSAGELHPRRAGETWVDLPV